MNDDRRKQERTEIWIDAVIRTDEAEFPAIATDLSGDGIRFQTQKPVLPGEKVTVGLKFNVTLEFHGIVVWTLGELLGGMSVYKVGIETDKIILDTISVNKPDKREELVEEILAKIK